MIERALGLKAAAAKDLQTALKFNPHFSPLQAPLARNVLRQLGV
jgi:hypothetical protein